VTRLAVSSGDGPPDPEIVRWMRRDMGRDLARRREEAGLTQEKFADLTGRYGRGTVSHAEICPLAGSVLARVFFGRSCAAVKFGRIGLDHLVRLV
jgi:hypothetical protein